MQIRPATAAEERAFYGHNDLGVRDLWGAFEGDECVAMCGLLRDPRFQGSLFEEDGAWIGFLELKPGVPPLGAAAVVEIRHFLKTQTHPIEVVCDHELPKAERLLTILGFRPTAQWKTDFRNRDRSRKLRVWQWQP